MKINKLINFESKILKQVKQQLINLQYWCIAYYTEIVASDWQIFPKIYEILLLWMIYFD